MVSRTGRWVYSKQYTIQCGTGHRTVKKIIVLHLAALCTLYISVQCVQCSLLCTVHDVQVARPQGKALTDHFRNRTKDFCWLSATPHLAVWFPQISIAACRYTVLNGFDCVSSKVPMFSFPACHRQMNESGAYVFVPEEHFDRQPLISVVLKASKFDHVLIWALFKGDGLPLQVGQKRCTILIVFSKTNHV